MRNKYDLIGIEPDHKGLCAGYAGRLGGSQ